MAATYAAGGTKIFPLWWPAAAGDQLTCACPAGGQCESPGKHPIGRLDHADGGGYDWLAPHGVNDATDSPREVARWWRLAPGANIGMPADRNGLAIVDVDPRHGGDRSLVRLRIAMVDRHCAWPMTVVQHTGGGGEHHLFAAPEGGVKTSSNAFGADLPGLDVRGRGGYVVVAPSRHVSGRAYGWSPSTAQGGGYARRSWFDDPPPWPALLTALAGPTRKGLAAAGVRVGPPERVVRAVEASMPRAERYVAVVVAGELDKLATCPPGGRNEQLNRSAYALGRFVAAGRLDEGEVTGMLFKAALRAGLDVIEIPKTITSGLAGGAGNTYHVDRALGRTRGA